MKLVVEGGEDSGAELRWDLRLTRELVTEVFGASQWKKAHASVRSVADRPGFCRYHYYQASDMLDEYIAANLEGTGLWAVFEDRDEFSYLMLRVRANVVAFVQSLHALADTCAHAIYYTLALDSVSKPLKEQNITASEVLKRLKQQRDAGYLEFAEIHDLFRALVTEGDYSYLNALANTSKHRAIVRPELNEDATGTRKEKWILYLESFVYQGVAYKKVNVRDFMRAEYDRVQALTVHIGTTLNAVLRARLALRAVAHMGGADHPAAPDS